MEEYYYDYENVMREDIKNYLYENYSKSELIENVGLECFREELYDNMFINDDITGNASGSYTFSNRQAQEYVLDNKELLKEAYEEFGGDLGKDFVDDNFEKMDVTIRCYILGTVLYEVLKDLEYELC